jgi:hypothetical protein
MVFFGLTIVEPSSVTFCMRNLSMMYSSNCFRRRRPGGVLRVVSGFDEALDGGLLWLVAS